MPRKKKILGTQFLRWETEGQKFSGKLIGKEPSEINGKATMYYTFSDGENKYRMLGTDQLNDALSEAPEGTDVEITYEGEQVTLGGFRVKRFRCEAYIEDDDDEEEAG